MQEKLYQIYRISSKDIVASYNELSVTYDDAVTGKGKAEIVSVQDNQVFHKIRDYYGDPTKEMREEIVNVVVPGDSGRARPNEKAYLELARTGFALNGNRYCRLCAGSGQIRRNTVSFVREELYDYLIEALSCGLTAEDFGDDFVPAKYNAYFGLNSSGVSFLSRPPRVCVVSDYEQIRPHLPVDYVQTVIEKTSGKTEKSISRVFYNEVESFPPINSFDGQGLCDPGYAKQMALDLGYLQSDGTGYVPSQFIIRAPWVKGLVVSFRWKDYCRSLGVTLLRDIYGNNHDIEDIDLLIGKSQFKAAGIYGRKDGWDYYGKSMARYNLRWGVVVPSKERDDDFRLLNYQYLSALPNLDNSDIQVLCSRTKDYLNRLCSDDIDVVYRTLIGCSEDDDDSCLDDDLEMSAPRYEPLFMKAVKRNPDLLQDAYIQGEILKQAESKLRAAKIGKIEVRGNYQFLVSDPVAQIQHIIHQSGRNDVSVTGLIPKGHVCSHYWNKCADQPSEVVLMRSPVIAPSEIAVRELYKGNDALRWYDTIQSGIILPISDLTALQAQNCDFDGDRVFSSNDSALIKGATDDPVPLMYDPKNPIKSAITPEALIRADVNGLNSKVGQLSNKGATFSAMACQYAPSSPECAELQRRIQILGELVGVEIDKAKTGVSPHIPENWQYKKINRTYKSSPKSLVIVHNADEETMRFNNKLVAFERPYFMRYRYADTDEKIKHYEKVFNQESRYNYGILLEDLLKLPPESLSPAQDDTIARYRRYYPSIDSPCTVNKICHIFERLVKDISLKPSGKDLLQSFSNGEMVDSSVVGKIGGYMLRYGQINAAFAKLSFTRSGDFGKEKIHDSERYRNLRTFFHDEMLETCSGDRRVLFEALLAQKRRCPEKVIWNLMGEDMLEIIPEK